MKKLFLVVSLCAFIGLQASFQDLLAQWKQKAEGAVNKIEETVEVPFSKPPVPKKPAALTRKKKTPVPTPRRSVPSKILPKQSPPVAPHLNKQSNNTDFNVDSSKSGFSEASPFSDPGVLSPPHSSLLEDEADFYQEAQEKNKKPSITLQQHPVLEQGINHDGGASCGYHAIKNATGVLSGELSLLNNVDFVKRSFDLDNGKWRMWVKNKNMEFDPSNNETDWLGVDMLGGLIKEVFPYQNYSIISYDGKSCRSGSWGQDELARVKNIMDEHNGRGYKHAFFINTINLSGFYGDSGSSGHWFTLVVDKKPDNSVVYTVMDSLRNKPRTDDEAVLNIVDKLSSD